MSPGPPGPRKALGRLFELLVDVVQMHLTPGLTAALSYVFLERAALIPSRPLRTLEIDLARSLAQVPTRAGPPH